MARRYDRPSYKFSLVDRVQLSIYSAEELAEGEDELDLLVRVYGPVLNSRPVPEMFAYARHRRVPGHSSQYRTAAGAT